MKINITALLNIMLMCLGALIAPNVSAASSSGWVRTDQSSLRLISERDGVADRDSLRIGLQIKLAPGWKTYWRTPGDAGIPPHFDWSGSENLKAAAVSWPLPEAFETYGLTSWGYHDEIVFPIDIKLKEAGEPLDLKLRLQLGICEKICIPYEHDFTLALNADTAEISVEDSIIDQYAKLVPKGIGTSSAMISSARAEALNSEDFIVTAHADTPFYSPQIIVEGIDGAYFQLVATELTQDRMTANFILKADFPAKTDILPGQYIIITISDKGKAAQGPLHVE